MSWIEACAADDIEAEGVIRFDHGGRTFAIYRSPDDAYYATDGFCTHEQAHLADGLVIDNIIECPMHNGRFDYTNRRGQGRPGLRRPGNLPGQGRGRDGVRRDRRLRTSGCPRSGSRRSASVRGRGPERRFP